MRVLLVEDNRRLSLSLKTSLIEEGYAVDTAYDGKEGLDLAVYTTYDVIILDVMLPGMNGLEVCQNLRRQAIKTPILLLTARDSVEDRVKGLDSGADDYLVKPFAMSELLARLRALLRREASSKSGLLQVGDLVIDPATHFVERNGQDIKLTAREYTLLEYFMRHPNQLITREMVENHLWNYEFESISNVVDVYVRRLRRKIDDPFEDPKMLETVRGAGYRLRVPLKK
ncbi:MAG: response regulator transcription factor [Chloroflexi bacterium]|nr:response regulator transcription factor [Chloroflexota bacterium]OJV89578.1 MAG: DNA-binding response regulator [Chloroflexi bacterium 54-19]